MADLLLSVKTLLDDGWIASNTATRTPTVSSIFDLKRVDFRMQESQDHIFLYELSRVPSDNASGALSKQTVSVVAVDIRTMLSRVQLDLVRVEVRRILNANQINPFSDGVFDISDITDDQDFSDKAVKLFRIQIKWRVEQLNVVL